ncbi:hypothetical protein KUTeg_009617 [Tegillarca granosa]|uniref:Uncharacterized protein n=1 Tax=Tegillarca granosa TaxID=220873 RepID=A0ABQ9F4F0_TEGGR|nr:hypothetical protein KUTeg_009617 [Tegillarca granosa]
MKDAILYFYPNYIPDDDKCLICGQLMGMAEFFLSTISKSPPKIFKLQNEKYCFKRVGWYSFQYGEHHRGFIAELNAFWDILLPMAGYHDNHLYQVFQVLPSVELPKGIMYSDDARTYKKVNSDNTTVTEYKPYKLKLNVFYLQLPCHDVKTDYELPVGVRLVSIFLTQDESTAVKPLYKNYNSHSPAIEDFEKQSANEHGQPRKDSKSTVIIAADVHAKFEDSSDSDKKSEDQSVNTGSPSEDGSKNISDSDIDASNSHGVSADESASEMPPYRMYSNKHMMNSKIANQNLGYKHPIPLQLSIDSSLPESSSTQIGDSLDSLGSDRTLVSWTSDIEGLTEVTMYIQRHSDISMLLLMENDSVEDEKVVMSLWKAALPHLADLDFYVKECTDAGINEAFLANQNFIQYDTFFQNIKGNVVQPLTGVDEEFHRLSGTMHESFLNNPEMTDIIHRSHSSCCYGHRTVNNETYYQLRNNAVQASSLPSSRHPMFAMEKLSARELTKHNINLL